MATCLVTGGAGFLGSHLCDELLRRGHHVICVDNLETGSLTNIEHIRVPEFEFLMKDIVQPYFVDRHVDVVYHLASPASPIDYLRLPLHTLKVGSHGTHHTLGLAKKHRARFLLASTSEVYGDPQVHPQKETYWGHVNPIGPRGVYDEAKRYAEALTMAYHRQQGVDTAIIRIFNSVLADEQVLFDDGTELRREPVAELAARLTTRAVPAQYEPRPVGGNVALAEAAPAIEYSLDGYRVPAFDAEGRIVPAPATSLIAHPTCQRCFEVRTRYGRSIRVTGDHSIFVEGADGEPEPRPVADLEVGDRVAIARRIAVPERDVTEFDMLDVWRRAEGDPWDLLVEAPGLGAQVWAQRRDVFGLLVSERRNAGANWRNGAWTKIIRMRDTDRVPLPVLRRVVDGVPAGARVRLRVAGRSVPLPADDRGQRRSAVADWAVGRRGLLARESPQCVHHVERRRDPARARRGGHRTAAWPPRRAGTGQRGAGGVDLRALQAPPAPDGSPWVRRQSQADSRLGARASPQPVEVVPRGLPRGRRRALRRADAGRTAARLHDRVNGAQGRSHRRARTLRPRAFDRSI